MPSHFAFDFENPLTGSVAWVHPDCHMLVEQLPPGACWLPGMFKGKTILHQCGEPMCVAPDHLELVEG